MPIDAACHWKIRARDAELCALRKSIGRGNGAILVGSSGVGKSKLLTTALRQAADEGRTVLSVGGVSWSSQRRTKGFESLAECLESVGPSTLNGSAADLPIIGIDNADLVDTSSGHRLYRLIAAGRLSVLAAIREGAVAPAGIDKLWVDGIIDYVEVAPFNSTALGDVLRTRLGGHVDTATLERLWAVTRGNALMLRELVEHALADKSLCCVNGTWVWRGLTKRPSKRLSDIVRLELKDLSHAEHELVNMLAVAEPLDIDIVAVSGLSHAAESLDLRGIVAVERAGTRVDLRLAVPLKGVVVATGMSDLTAQRLRCQVADALERTGTRRVEDLLRIVSLRMEAGITQERDKLLAAARAALRGRDFVLAERLCLLALSDSPLENETAQCHPVPGSAEYADDLCRLVARAVRRSEPVDRVRAALLLGQSLIGKGCPQEAEAVLATTLESDVEVPRSEYVAAVHIRVINLAWRLRRAADAAAVLAHATASVSSEHIGVLHASHAVIAVLSDQMEEAVAIGDAVLHTETVSLSIAQALVPVVALARSELGDPAGALRLISKFRNVSYDWDMDALVLTDAVSARCSYLSGDLQQAADTLDAPRPYDSVDRWPGLVRNTIARSWLLRLQGQPQRAVALLREAISFEGGHEWSTAPAWPLAQLAGALAESGRHSEALFILAEVRLAQPDAASHPIAEGQIAHDRALVLAYTGDRSGAVAQAVELAEQAAASGRTATAVMALHLAARVKESAACKVRYLARTLSGESTGALVHVMADHIQALAEGDGDTLFEVSKQFRDMGALPFAAEAAAQATHAYRASGQRRKARAAWAACQNLLRVRGAALPPWTAPEYDGLSGVVTLTPREQEVAVLAESGLSNRDIADRLVVSIRTVENHLHRAYHKLGINARNGLQQGLEQAAMRADGAGPMTPATVDSTARSPVGLPWDDGTPQGLPTLSVDSGPDVTSAFAT